MKYSNTIITLLVILFAALLLGTFLGVKSREGIAYSKLSILEDILTRNDRTNQEKIETINTLNIQDDDFAKVLNNNEYDDDRKISEINLLVNSLLKTNISGETYTNALSMDITPKTSTD
jgi:hypothetical protein